MSEASGPPLPSETAEAPRADATAPIGWTAWQGPKARPEVAPGLVFADTAARAAAYLVDMILIGIVAWLASAVMVPAAGPALAGDPGWVDVGHVVRDSVQVLSLVTLGLVYFVACWSGGRRATIGQRLFGIQVGNAFDGRPLSLEQAIGRWFGLGLFLSLFEIVLPPNRGWFVFVPLTWSLVLIVSTIASPTKQGLHDRLAGSALVRPSGSSRTAAFAVLILFGLVAALAVALFFLALYAMQHMDGG